MKNRALKKVISLVLVGVLIISLAGCGSTSDVVQTTTPQTTAPTTSPTVTPTVAPDVDEKDDTSSLLDVKIEGVSGVFGSENETFGGVEYPGYFSMTWDTSEIQDAFYSLYFELEISTDDDDFEGTVTIPASNSSAYPTFSDENNSNGLLTAFDDGFKRINFGASNSGVDLYLLDSKLIIAFSDAGEYSISCDVTITDRAPEYGAFVSDDDPYAVGISLNSEIEIAKQNVTLSVASAVIENSEYRLLLEAETAIYSKYDTFSNSADETITLYLPEYIEIGDDKVYVTYELGYVEEAKTGTYTASFAESYIFGGTAYDDLEELSENFKNYNITKAEDITIYAISSYDMAEIGDVITSITEIDFATTGGYNSTFEYFFGAGCNTEVQAVLALVRYENLSQEQKAYFETYADPSVFNTFSRGNVNAFISKAGSLLDIELRDDVNSDQAITLLEYLNFAIQAIEEREIYTAFDDFCDDAELKTASEFNVKSSTQLATFASVEEYFNSQSEDAQEIIEEHADWYSDYTAISTLVYTAEADGTQQLVVGAYSAYLKAISNGSTVYYQDSDTGISEITRWAYIDSSEVSGLLLGAWESYNSLSSGAKEIMDSTSGGFDGISGVVTVTGDCTYLQILEQLQEMEDMIAVIKNLTDYVNIQDYIGSTGLGYDRLSMLVYGENGGLYFPDGRYAIGDLFDAPERNYDAIIEEYKAWMTYIVKIEDYKTTIMLEFMSEISSRVSALSTDDYSEAVLATAKSSSNMVAGMILGAVMVESVYDLIGMESINGGYSVEVYPGYVVEFLPDVFYSTDILGGDGVEMTPYFDSEGEFLEDIESVEDIKNAILANFLDIEDLLDTYIDAIIEK